MKVFAFFDADAPPARHDADFLRLWERSWRRMGWTPKILTSANRSDVEWVNAEVSAIVSTGGGAWYSDPRVINFGFKPFRPKRLFYSAKGVFWVAPKRIRDWLANRLIPDRDSSSISAVFDPMHIPNGMLVFFEGCMDTSVVPPIL